MTAGCSHHGPHTHGSSPYLKRLWAVVLLVAAYCVLEVVGGFWTGSLALLADASHMASDLASLLVSLWAAWLITRRPSRHQTFGFHRAEILAALFNGGLLFVVAGGILHEAWERFTSPQPILGGMMLLIAIGGLIVNLISLSILHAGKDHNLNLRGAWLHVMGDTFGSVAVIAAAVLVWTLNWNWADPVASVIACLIILYSAWHLVADAVHILMESAPREIDVAHVRRQMLGVPGVTDVHCLHVWTIASGLKSLSSHVVIEPGFSSETALAELRQLLRTEFHLHHLTLQMESSESTLCPDRNDGDCLII